MATTAADIISGAYARRTANDPGKLASDRELVSVLSRFLRRVYSDVAKVSPEFFAKISSAVAPASNKWPRPTDAVTIFKVELEATGVEVHRTPFLDKQAEVPPAIYELGRSFYSVGRAADVANGIPADPNSATESLKFYYSMMHPALSPATAPSALTLDASWPEHHNELLVLYLARYLAMKDGRNADEVTTLTVEIDDSHALLLEEAQGDDYRERHRWKVDPPAQAE